ncbi:MAG: 30S ribosomal protein S16 [Planctomycetes bacterium]|nr:30S ribosomal protein S16 [Planctomycetota bacterium]
MAVVIRLRRTGRTNLPCFRITATDSRFPRDGRSLENLGLYDPLRRDVAQQVQLDRERIEYWLSQGAKASDSVASILRRNGMVVARPQKKRERVRYKKTSVRTQRDAASKARADAKLARASVRKQQKRAAAKAAAAEAPKEG